VLKVGLGSSHELTAQSNIAIWYLLLHENLPSGDAAAVLQHSMHFVLFSLLEWQPGLADSVLVSWVGPEGRHSGPCSEGN
jgi:hypothetical protein